MITCYLIRVIIQYKSPPATSGRLAVLAMFYVLRPPVSGRVHFVLELSEQSQVIKYCELL